MAQTHNKNTSGSCTSSEENHFLYFSYFLFKNLANGSCRIPLLEEEMELLADDGGLFGEVRSNDRPPLLVFDRTENEVWACFGLD